jgi:uncharacterized caspase-like protein
MGAGASTDAGDAPGGRPKRLALCIGLSDVYGPDNAAGGAADAAAVADVLQNSGWSVRLVLEPREPGAEAVKEAVASTVAALKPGDHVLVFFSGHAAPWQGGNHLVCAGA